MLLCHGHGPTGTDIPRARPAARMNFALMAANIWERNIQRLSCVCSGRHNTSTTSSLFGYINISCAWRQIRDVIVDDVRRWRQRVDSKERFKTAVNNREICCKYYYKTYVRNIYHRDCDLVNSLLLTYDSERVWQLKFSWGDVNDGLFTSRNWSWSSKDDPSCLKKCRPTPCPPLVAIRTWDDRHHSRSTRKVRQVDIFQPYINYWTPNRTASRSLLC